ncbi:VCBS repeat-containing protein [Candidatus Nitronereus thalassa]|uniref:VCBS repeat-containing protein n=1 Tax=Candidatus Nitronereus thalassa TaxID=3020898 RepID=A0ABU3K8C3_9BACT|nr:VCBS repeat-containing protein [Candidatus Nitronereus thalassa]MDT7042649.1 VCBS repeat-containing protein [Candidatus Nitronereus thalassa]
MVRTLAILLLLLSVSGCPSENTYVPPDLLYLYKSYDVEKNPTAIQAADFNQDGFTDLITSNIAANSLSLLFGNGDGSFQAQVTVRVCREPRNLAIEDFNRDAHLDLAIACSGSDQVSILAGHGDGTFDVVAQYHVNRTPVSISTGDFNSDQLMDFVVALRNDKLQLFFGNGIGKFRLGPLYEYGDTPTSVVTADLNQDGHLDMAVSNGGPMSSAVSIWLGQGDGNFLMPTDYRTGKRPLSVSLSDFNNDGVLDLFVINGQMNTITVFLGNGDGTFQEGIDSGGDAGPNHGLAQDFNGDQIMDVAVVNIQSGSMSVLYGKGDGSFQYPPRQYETPYGPFAITSLTLAKGRGEQPGLAIANNAKNSVSIFLHHGLKSRENLAKTEEG